MTIAIEFGEQPSRPADGPAQGLHSAGMPHRRTWRLGAKFMPMVVASALLSACVPSEGPTTETGPAIKVSANAGPGPNLISAARARSAFSALCIETGGDRSATEVAAAADGFIRHATFGTYYHPRDNLSVKLTDGDCSMVFGSAEPAAKLQKALTSLTSGPPGIRFDSSLNVGGTQYYNARIVVQ